MLLIPNKSRTHDLNNFIDSCCCCKDEQMLWCHLRLNAVFGFNITHFSPTFTFTPCSELVYCTRLYSPLFAIFELAVFKLKIGLKSSFVVTQFPQKRQSNRITNLSNLEYMVARFEYKPLFASLFLICIILLAYLLYISLICESINFQARWFKLLHNLWHMLKMGLALCLFLNKIWLLEHIVDHKH